MTFYVYYYTLFNSATMVDTNGNINLGKSSQIIELAALCSLLVSCAVINRICPANVMAGRRV